MPPTKTDLSMELGAFEIPLRNPPGKRSCSSPSEPDQRLIGRSLSAAVALEAVVPQMSPV
jgi:hypothetical protein